MSEQNHTETATITKAWTDGQWIPYEADTGEHTIKANLSRGSANGTILDEKAMHDLAEEIVGKEITVPNIAHLLQPEIPDVNEE